MRVLFDHNMPAQVRFLLTPHEVHLAREMVWDRLTDGNLLRAAEEASFDVMVTADQGIYYQQNNAKRKIALVIIKTDDMRLIHMGAEDIRHAIARSHPGSDEVVVISGRRKPRLRC